MGVSSMAGVQFLERISLFFKQSVNHPQVPFVRRVSYININNLDNHMFNFVELMLSAGPDHKNASIHNNSSPLPRIPLGNQRISSCIIIAFDDLPSGSVPILWFAVLVQAFGTRSSKSH